VSSNIKFDKVLFKKLIGKSNGDESGLKNLSNFQKKWMKIQYSKISKF